MAQEDITFVTLSTECAATTQVDTTVLVWTGTYYRVITLHVWVSSTFPSCYIVPSLTGGNKSQGVFNAYAVFICLILGF